MQYSAERAILCLLLSRYNAQFRENTQAEQMAAIAELRWDQVQYVLKNPIIKYIV